MSELRKIVEEVKLMDVHIHSFSSLQLFLSLQLAWWNVYLLSHWTLFLSRQFRF